MHLRGFAGERFLKRDLHIVAKVGAALAAAGASTARHAEDALEDIAEGRAEVVAEAVRRAAALLEGGMAEAVVSGALLGASDS